MAATNGSSALAGALRTLFKIEPGEGAKVGLMFLYSLSAVGGAFVVGRSVSRSLFLSGLPRADIPYKFIGMAVGVVLAASIYARVASRFRRDRMIIVSHVIMAALVLAFRFIFATDFGKTFPALCGLFVAFEVVAAIMNIQFWTFAADIFNPREAKRLFGLVAAGGVFSNVVAGAALRALSPYVRPEDMIFVFVASMLVCIACVYKIGEWHAPQLTAAVAKARAAMREAHAKGAPRSLASHASGSLFSDLKDLRASPQLLSITGIIAATTLVTNIAEYQMDLTLQTIYAGDGRRMSAFLGEFFFWSGIAACAVQFFLTGRIIERYGVLAALLLLPGGILLGSTAILISGAQLWAVAMTRGADVMFRYTINDATLNLLYLPVPADFRARAKALIDGQFKPIATGVSGLLFLGLAQVKWVHIEWWSVPALLLLGVWLWLVSKARAQYMVALAEHRRTRRVDLSTTAIDVADEATVRVLVESLRNPDARQVLHALEIIESARKVNWERHVVPLLQHEEPAVRTRALAYLGKSGTRAHADVIRARFSDTIPEVRASAVAAYCDLLGYDSIEAVVPLLGDASTQVSGAAVAGLIRMGGLEGVLHAAERLKLLLTSHDAGLRAEGARVLGAIGVQNYYHPLLKLFDDAAPVVQVAAIRAAGSMRSPELVKPLLAKLANRATASAAVEALAAYGAGVEPAIGPLLHDETTPAATRVQLAKVLARVGTAEAVKMLMRYLSVQDDSLRSTVCHALARLKKNNPALAVDQPAVRHALEEELRRAYDLHMTLADLTQEPHAALLAEALAPRIEETMTRIFDLLTLIGSAEAIATVRRNMGSPDKATRATAVELLDNLVDRDTAKTLLPLMEATGERIREIAFREFGFQPRGIESRLVAYSKSHEPWLCACAIYALGEMRAPVGRDTIRDALASVAPLVRETALVSVTKLFDDVEARGLVARLVSAQEGDARYAGVQELAQRLLTRLPTTGIRVATPGGA